MKEPRGRDVLTPPLQAGSRSALPQLPGRALTTNIPLVLGKTSPPRDWLNTHIPTCSSTELSADPCSSTRTALSLPETPSCFCPSRGKPVQTPDDRSQAGPPLAASPPRLRRAPGGRAGLTYLAAAVGLAGTTGASPGRDGPKRAAGRRHQQHRPGAGLTCGRPEEERGQIGARSLQPPGGGEARGGRPHLSHSAREWPAAGPAEA